MTHIRNIVRYILLVLLDKQHRTMKRKRRRREKKKNNINSINGNASLPALDSTLFYITRVADAQIGGGAHAIVTAAEAHWHASRPRRVRGAENVTALARALIQAGALAVQARKLAERLGRRGDASAGVGIERESLVARATIGADADAVRPATALALRPIRLARRLAPRLRAPARRGIHGHPVIAHAHVGPHAEAAGAAPVPATERVGERDALLGVRVQLEAQVAGALVGADAVRVRAAVQATVRPRRPLVHGRPPDAAAARVGRVARVAGAHSRRNAFAVRATLGTVGRAVVVGVQSVARVALASVRRDASPVRAIPGTRRDALSARVHGVAGLAGAGTGRHALAIHAAQRALGHAPVGGDGVEGEARAALAHTGRHALAVGAAQRALGHASVGGVEGEAWLALAHAGRHALAVRAAQRALGHACVASVEDVVRLALANGRGDALAVRAAGRTVGHAVFGLVRRIDVSERKSRRRVGREDSWLLRRCFDLPFVAGAHPRSCALSVTATVFAHRHAFSVRSLHPRLQLVPGPALAHVRRHAFPVHAPARADRPALAVHLLVAQFARAHVRREAVRVLLAGLLAVRPADALPCHPARRTAAHVRPRAVPPQASLGADRVAGTGVKIALVPVATIQNRYPSAFLLTRKKEKEK